jgi:Flp pilus assembly protein CpaB
LFIIVGLLLAVLAFGGVFLIGGTLGVGNAIGGNQTTVVIAKQSIPVRHQITAADLDTEKVTGNFAAVNTYSKANDVVNLIAEIQISKGALITSDMLAKDIGLVPAGSAPAYLPLASGYVAMTIPTSEQQGVAGRITLGDYITVISSAIITIFSTTTGNTIGPPKVVSKTVFTNVRVIGLGPATSNVQPASGATNVSNTGGATSGVTSSLTVELTQCDAEYLVWFIQNTSVRYTLESFNDYLKAPPSTPDPACPTIQRAGGVTQTEVDARYHFTAL